MPTTIELIPELDVPNSTTLSRLTIRSRLAGDGALHAGERVPSAQPEPTAPRARQREARDVTITRRDDWGIAHVHGRTDADAVFGMAYAQAEDDFNRVETNYLNAMGRLAEAEGESAIWRTCAEAVHRPDALKAQYAEPGWLQALMTPGRTGSTITSRRIRTCIRASSRISSRGWRSSFTKGSIGGDIERVSLADLEAFYGGAAPRGAGRKPRAGRSRRAPTVRDRARTPPTTTRCC